MIPIYNSPPKIQPFCLFRLLGIEVLLQANTQLFPEWLELFKVLIVLSTVLDFRLDSYSYSYHQPIIYTPRRHLVLNP